MPTDADLKALIAQHERYLQVLKEQQAAFGLNAPAHILIGIEDISAEIDRLKAQLSGSEPPRPQSNLPRQPFFFGREEELATIAQVLEPENRGWGLLIDGPGGIGKTALARQAVEIYRRLGSPELQAAEEILRACEAG